VSKLRFGIVISFLVALLLNSTLSPAAIGIENRQGAQLQTRELRFIDDEGKPVLLDRYFHSRRPVLMALVYFGCPGVCTVLLNGMIDGLKQLKLDPGRAFEVVVVSIDPKESHPLAKAKKENYLSNYGRQNTANGWHFLTGKEADITALSQQVGFQYERDPETGIFVHPSALFVLTPEGVLSSTLGGVRFSKKLLRVSLLEAAGGQMGTFLDRLSSICYAYLPHTSWLNSPQRWFFLLSGLGIGLFLIMRRLFQAPRVA